jgi:hypothetical protein
MSLHREERRPSNIRLFVVILSLHFRHYYLLLCLSIIKLAQVCFTSVFNLFLILLIGVVRTLRRSWKARHKNEINND